MYYRDFPIDNKYKELKEKKLYPTYIEIFYVSAVIGCLLNKRIEGSNKDSENDGSRGRIIRSVFLDNEKNYRPYIQMIGMIHHVRSGEKAEGIRKVFKESEEEQKELFEIVASYANGGINVLYQNMIGDATNDDEIIKNTKNFLVNFEEIVPYFASVEGKSFEDIIKEGM